MNLRQIKAIEAENKGYIKNICPNASERSGIYALIREEDGIKYAYIGQAKRLLTRIAQHFTGYQHIDLSLKNHKLWSNQNPAGYKVRVIECDESQLDELEQKYIKEFANLGYQLRNRTSGGQGKGKKDIAEEGRKGYQLGLKNGYDRARKEIKHLFDLHLDARKKSDKPNKNQDKALQKFKDFMDIGGE